ncbi:hypothetical protein [Asticcacaulis sp. W401b]|uniref:hypothetical protein n=1 Tax=Asticcacaulis sp. W401b TaxID=3388666 RepID=UPI0039710690
MPKDVTLQDLRQAINNGIAGDYACARSEDVSLESWSWQAKELEDFAQGKGYFARSHPTAIGGREMVDLVVVRI